MTVVKTKVNRRAFLRSSALAGGGLMLSFNWLAGGVGESALSDAPKEWLKFNGFIKISDEDGIVLMSPNPEGGQNIKTAMPMIVAEELDVDWEEITVEQAPLDTEAYSRQYIGGSQAIRRGWTALRTAGATARQMLIIAAAQAWNVPANEITTSAGVLHHQKSGKSAKYTELASAAVDVPVPEDVSLKSVDDFAIVGTSKKNVDLNKIITGKPLFGIDYHVEGMLYATIVKPPKFGTTLKAIIDESKVKEMPGIKDVFMINSMKDDYEKQYFDTVTFTDLAVVVGESTWQVMQAKKALEIEFEPFQDHVEVKNMFGRKVESNIPGGLENTTTHKATMQEMATKPGRVNRKDGDPEQAFQNAAKVIERSFTGPFLAHNCMEPMNFFADVTDERANLAGPLQKPELTEQALSARLGMPLDKIHIEMTRLGGGYGRRSYAHWLLEAALISQKMKAPVKLVYTREDDMTAGIYRPTYHAKFRAALDEQNNLIGFHVKAGGIPESPLSANRFPAGTVDNYLAESWSVDSNITIGSFRAPRSNFMASAEQSFLDEVAEAAEKDPIQFRIDLLERAKSNPVGNRNDYDADRFIEVLKLVREKSGWDKTSPNVGKGVSAYFCHNSYAAQVLELTMENGQPKVGKVTCAVDCGIVVNPDSASNMVEGAIVDGIGTALYGELTFTDGSPDKNNFDKYRMIRMNEAPSAIDVHFVQNNIDPTGLGEPAYPPVFAAVANALYSASGQRYYNQPFMGEEATAQIN